MTEGPGPPRSEHLPHHALRRTPELGPRRHFCKASRTGSRMTRGRGYFRYFRHMRYRVLVEIKASRVVTLDAASPREALAAAEHAAFPGKHRRDKVTSLIAPGYPKKAARPAKPRVDVPD